jgi:tetratricopeptide (TPR) repeat protein
MTTHSRLLQALCTTLISSVTALLLNSTALGQSRTPDVPLTPLGEAQAALERRDWASAETLLNPLLKVEPKNPFAYFEMAQLYENTNRMQAAKNIYQAIAAIPEAEKSNFVVIAIKDNKKYMVLLPNLAQERLDALNRAAPTATAAAAAPVAAAPTATANPVSTPSSVESAPAVMAMRQWQAAWQSKQLAAYFASYVSGFKGDTATSGAWQKARAQRINTKSKISINAYDIALTPLDAQQVQLDFTQAYVSNSFVDITRKTLVMINSNGRWLITKETTK